MFRTEIDIPLSEHKISLSTPLISLGSCFADIIGGKLKSNKFNILSNPFGVIYNPISVFSLLETSVRKEDLPPSTYLENQEIHYNYCFHSDISALTRTDLERKASFAFHQVHQQLLKAKWIIITLGTAFVFRRKDNHEIVANCHKIPDSFFSREMLEPEEILNRFEKTYQMLSESNPGLRFIFTVSPVRHLRDTLPQNAVSKSILRYVCDKLVKTYDNVDYFPSFELLLDDLRDYRFYASDMVHPNDVSENYIWEKFTTRYLDDNANSFLKDWDKLSRAVYHRPFYPESSAHQTFLVKTLKKLKQLNEQIDVSEEIKVVEQQIILPQK